MKSDNSPRRPNLAPPRPDSQRAVWSVSFFLVVAVFVVFGQTVRHEFINYDDDLYVTDNPQVAQGLTFRGIGWAFTYSQIGHWHPLTWLSHMLDCQLYRLNPGGHHLTNVLLHATNAVLLFLVLRQMMGLRISKNVRAMATPASALWPSAFIAAVFAIHPLRVESVAWVAERKDVLSGLFFMLTLGAYVRYVRQPSSLVNYSALVLLFAMGLLSKNMLVTMPFVLLLLDYWPLGRLSPTVVSHSSFETLGRLLIEKLPLFLLSAASCIATSLVSEKIPVADRFTLFSRLQNGLVSYVTYLWQTVCPVALAIPYPMSTGSLPSWKLAGALFLLAAISLGAWVLRKQHPCLIVGWLWYVGMLVPVTGIVQISYYAHADRYTYLPQIGLTLAVVWALQESSVSWRYRREVLATAAAGVIAALMVCAAIQTSYWRNNELLWKHTLACTPENARANNNLGNALIPQSRFNEAIEQYQQALHINPDYAEAHNNLGNALALQGRYAEAIGQYQLALHINPEYLEAHYNLGDALMRSGRSEEAIDHFKKVLELRPGFAKAHNKSGAALVQIGRPDEAIIHFQKAIEIDAGYADAHYNLARALGEKGRLDEAVVQFQATIRMDPNNADAHGNLAKALATQGKLAEAVGEYQRTIELIPNSALAHFRFGQALQAQRDFKAAITQFQKAIQLDPRQLPAYLDLAWLLATGPAASLRDGSEAVKLALQAERLAGSVSPQLLDTLAAAYAEAGRYADAIETAKRALNLNATQNNQPLAEAIQARLKLYEAHAPYHASP